MKILLEHLKNNQDSLQQYSKYVIDEAKHCVNLGTAREGLITNFLQQNLPEYIKYHTGEIFDSRGERSGQIDIVLHPITAPKIHLFNSISLFPVETVLAAIEVKSNLTTGQKSHLSSALNSCKELKQLKITKQRSSNNRIIDTNTIPFIIFAYTGTTLDNLKIKLSESLSSGYTAQELPDLIIVLDKGYYLVKSKHWMQSGITINDLYQVHKQDYVLLGIYEFILKLIEYWFLNPFEHTMPIEEYTKDMPTLFKFLKNDNK